MNRLQKKVTNINIVFALLTLFLYFMYRVFNTFLVSLPKGDEHSFLRIFKIFLEKGYNEANLYGNSTLFNVFSSIFYKMGANELMSLKITSLICGLISLLLVFYFQKKHFSHLPNIYRYIASITSLNVLVVSSILFNGINDLILVVLVLVFFIILYRFKEVKTLNSWLFVSIGFLFALMLLTRLMSILFIFPMILLLTIMLYSMNIPLKKIFLKSVISILVLFTLLMVFNYPSLNENGTLSFHEKKLSYEEDVNWIQLQYLSETGYEEGMLKYGKHYTPKQVAIFLENNGKSSLPSSTIEAIFFDLKRTIHVFIREFVFLVKPFTRLIGVLFVFNFFLFINLMTKKKLSIKKIIKQEILLFSFIYICSLCIVINSYMEPRWLISVFLLLPIVFVDKAYNFEIENRKSNKFRFILLNLHLLAIVCMNIPYLYKNFNLFF